MALTRCPDCNSDISSSAPSCPKCGRPMFEHQNNSSQTQSSQGKRCNHCGGTNIGKARGLQGIGEVLIFLILFALGIIPGIIYYIYIESVPYCSSCGKRT